MIKKSFLFLIYLFLCQSLFAEAVPTPEYYYELGVAKTKNSDLFGAIKCFEKACHLSPLRNSYLKSLAASRFDVANLFINQGKHEQAERYLELAAEHDSNALLYQVKLLELYLTLNKATKAEMLAKKLAAYSHNNELIKFAAVAICKLQNKNLAINCLREHLLQYEGNYDLAKLLGELLYERGELAESRLYLLRAQEIAGTFEIKELLRKVALEADIKANLKCFENEYFLLWYPEDAETFIHSQFVANLNGLYQKLGDAFDCFPNEKLEVLFLNIKDFKTMINTDLEARGRYDGKIILALDCSYSPKEIMRSLRHEYVHHLVAVVSNGNAPLWIDEGLAELFEDANLYD